MTGIERMAAVLEEWAAATGGDAPRFDENGNVELTSDFGETMLGVREDGVYVTADAGDAEACAYPDMLVCRLMEANSLWVDSFGFTYALDGRNHVVLQDRRPSGWFGDGRGFAAYLANLEDARRLARDLIAFGKEGSNE